ncbi:DUF2993 domain-containing protein [Spirulina sp. 06S082]|uniref:LmeA family phospholipid-binding protein n=1 Tax=Spirulina sp. 06S082 TaxID=3110248 RepID=UPI002B21E808|nr:DUF2993 domain-containing protein [Spirulina sp. 06S082]MEA5472189.1 DUF2993 domain-containing protein [Spirulina sp. 06S082]
MGKIISLAFRLWLRSQTDRLEHLEVKISGKNRQILTGHIPKVALAIEGAIYRGLHFTQGCIIGENIRINLGQVIKGKPLQILEPITARGEVLLAERDLQTSLNSPLLSTALKDFLFNLVPAQGNNNLEDWQIDWHNIEIQPQEIFLTGVLTTPDENATPLRLQAGLALLSPSQLRLFPLAIESSLLKQIPEEFYLDLGGEVQLEALNLSAGQIFIKGGIVINP